MDLSDGLIADLGKLCRASGVAAKLDDKRVPVAPVAEEVAEMLNRDALIWALRGGEDYELLLTVAPDAVDRLRAAITAAGTAATVVGEIVEGEGVMYEGDGNLNDVWMPGWDHFVHP